MFSRQLWANYFSGYLPTLPCPSCNSVSLAVQKDTLKEIETGSSRAAHAEEYWNPELEESRFCAILKCRVCGECVAVGGTSGTEEDRFINQEGEEDSNYVSTFRPVVFHPAPPVFAIIRECPPRVKAHLQRAFGLIWSDAGACANALRSGVEALLDHQGVAKFALSSKRKRVALTTHTRVEKFAKKNGDAAAGLMAIKWIGNAGSHETAAAPKREDLLEGFELFEQAIEIVFMRKLERFKKLARDISRRKGRAKGKKRPTSKP